MTPDRFSQVEEIFQQAMDLALERRDAYLRERCGSDVALRAEVETLLRHERAALATAAYQDSSLGVAAAAQTELIGLPARFGRYTLTRKLGAGGMGVVYEAEQQQPHRTVALKLVHPTFASAEFLQRFKREAELLGNLQHPGIVQVYDADTADLRTDGGMTLRLPYFAMERVQGSPLDEYVRLHGPSVKQRLELMAAICDAVQHAHQHGVIHRDLKPANILVVGKREGENVGRDGVGPLSAVGALPSHLPTFPPSHVSAQPKILDFGVARSAASDVQATLQTNPGQIIGTLAYMSPEQVRGDVREIDTRSDVYSLGVILFELLAGRPPYNLSNRSIADVARTITESPVPRLGESRRELRGELELIVATAMAKDKQRRYASAAELADDLRRYVSGRPIRAKGDAALYVLRKFVMRHRGAVAVGALLALALGAAAIVAGVYQFRSREQERIAAAQRTVAAAFDRLIFELMSSPVLNQAGVSPADKTKLLRQLASQWIQDPRLKDSPEAEAAILVSLGNQFAGLQMFAEAEPLLRRGLELHRRLFGHEDLDAARSCNDLGGVLHVGRLNRDEAENLLREALRIRLKKLASDDLNVAESMNNLAACLGASGDANKRAEAERLYEQALSIRRRQRGDDHLDVAVTSNNLGMLRLEMNRPAEAEAPLRTSIRIREFLGHVEHMSRGISLINLGAALRAMVRLDEAEFVLREAGRVIYVLTPEGHPYRGTVAFHLGRVLADQGAIDEAVFYLCESYELRRDNPQGNEWGLRDTESELGAALAEQGRRADGEAHLAAAAEALWRGWREKAAPAGFVKRAAERLMRFYEQEGRLDEAALWRARAAEF